MVRASVRAEAPRLVWRVSIPLFLAVKDIGCGFSAHEPRFYRVVGGGRFRGVRGRWRSVSRRFSTFYGRTSVCVCVCVCFLTHNFLRLISVIIVHRIISKVFLYPLIWNLHPIQMHMDNWFAVTTLVGYYFWYTPMHYNNGKRYTCPLLISELLWWIWFLFTFLSCICDILFIWAFTLIAGHWFYNNFKFGLITNK